MLERLKTGNGATEVDVKLAAIELILAQSDLALAEGSRDASIQKLQDALHQAQTLQLIQQASSRGGISADLDGLVKANQTVSEIKLKLIRLQHQASTPNSTSAWSQQAANPKAALPPTGAATTSVQPPATDSAVPTSPFSDPLLDGVIVKEVPSPGPGVPGTPYSSTPNSVSSAVQSITPPFQSASTAKHKYSLVFFYPEEDAAMAKQFDEEIAPGLSPFHVDISKTALGKNGALFNDQKIEPPFYAIYDDNGRGIVTLTGLKTGEQLAEALSKIIKSTGYSSASKQAFDVRPSLRYDGKTFNEWRDVWKTELSTSKRVEAVKALAAFGANGYEKEAAESILDVASTYDFDSSGTDPEFSSAVQDALISKVPVKEWRPLLRNRYDQNPKKWATLAEFVLRGTRDTDDSDSAQNREFLATIARQSANSPVSHQAMDSLIRAIQIRRRRHSYSKMD